MAGFVSSHFLSVLVFLPLLIGVVGILIPASSIKGQTLIKNWAFFGSLVVFVASIGLYIQYDPDSLNQFQLLERMEWIPSFGASYFIGIDGISLWLILLTTFMMPLVILGSFSAVTERIKEYYLLLLMLETAMLGAFVALDVFLFYVFWEAMLIPMYFLIGIWGGKERIYATTKFFLYTLFGSLLMLVAIFYIVHQYKLQFGVLSTSLFDLYQLNLPGFGFFSVQSILFLAFALAFAIKVPLFPFHTWLPDAHVQAPTAGSVILAGVLLKMGGYGFIRFAFPLFPDAVVLYQTFFLILGAIAIFYGACLAWVQPDIKKLVAYSSVSHMGYVIIGLFSLNQIGVTGSVYQMLNHGISTGALFLLVGMIYERRHTRDLDAFGGLAKVMPFFAVAFLIVTLASVALPGTNGFIGEFLILLGVWKTNHVIAIIAALGVILGAVYMLWAYQKVALGPLDKDENRSLRDLTLREKFVLAPFIVAIFFMGLFPNFFFSKMESSVDHFLKTSQRTHQESGVRK